MKAVVCTGLAVALLGSAGSFRAVSAQSLGDVARQEEARRKAIHDASTEASKVYTNEDLEPVPPSTGPQAADSGDKTASTPDAKDKEPAKADASKSTKGPQKDAAYWSGRVKELNEQLDRDQTFAEALQSRINGLTTDFVNRDDPAQRGVIERDRQKSIAELDRLKKQIESDKKAISDLEEEARRAGVPAGWLRP